MIANQSERTRHRVIHLPCVLEVGHQFLRGNTCELSEEEGTVLIPALAYPDAKPPHHGTPAILTLGLHRPGGTMREILKIPAKISYVATTLLGMQLNTLAFDDRQKKIFDAVLSVKT